MSRIKDDKTIMGKRIGSFALLTIASCFAFGGNRAAAVKLSEQARLSKSFLSTYRIKIPPVPGKIKAIVYGNSRYGYFATQDHKIEKGVLSVNLVPPGYKAPLEFYLHLARRGKPDVYRRLGEKRFSSPVPKIYEDLRGHVKKGSFSSNFFLVNGALPKKKLMNPDFTPDDPKFYKKNKHRFSFAMIVNRYGEIVWIHVPVYRGSLMSSYIVGKPVGRGRYGLLFGKQEGYFEIAGYKGRVVYELSSRDAPDPFSMHHDFLLASNKTVYTIGNKRGQMSSWNPLADGGKDFLTNTIISFQLGEKRKREVYDFLEVYNPKNVPYWTGDKPDDKKFVRWKEPKADFDFLHLNAIDKSPQGHLVSIRNVNRVAMMDPGFNEILWTMGPHESDTYQIRKKEDRYMHMHTPSMIGRDKVLLFDNGRKKKRSRVMIFKLDDKKQAARAIWTYNPKPRLFSKNRSSAERLKNDNILTYFVSPRPPGAKRPPRPNVDHLIEVDAKTRREVGHMTLTYDVLTPGYRATPLSTVGTERYLGRKPPPH